MQTRGKGVEFSAQGIARCLVCIKALLEEVPDEYYKLEKDKKIMGSLWFSLGYKNIKRRNECKKRKASTQCFL